MKKVKRGRGHSQMEGWKGLSSEALSGNRSHRCWHQVKLLQRMHTPRMEFFNSTAHTTPHKKLFSSQFCTVWYWLVYYLCYFLPSWAVFCLELVKSFFYFLTIPTYFVSFQCFSCNLRERLPLCTFATDKVANTLGRKVYHNHPLFRWCSSSVNAIFPLQRSWEVFWKLLSAPQHLPDEISANLNFKEFYSFSFCES